MILLTPKISSLHYSLSALFGPPHHTTLISPLIVSSVYSLPILTIFHEITHVAPVVRAEFVRLSQKFPSVAFYCVMCRIVVHDGYTVAAKSMVWRGRKVKDEKLLLSFFLFLRFL